MSCLLYQSIIATSGLLYCYVIEWVVSSIRVSLNELSPSSRHRLMNSVLYQSSSIMASMCQYFQILPAVGKISYDLVTGITVIKITHLHWENNSYVSLSALIIYQHFSHCEYVNMTFINCLPTLILF